MLLKYNQYVTELYANSVLYVYVVKTIFYESSTFNSVKCCRAVLKMNDKIIVEKK